MKILVLADIDDIHWGGGSGQADILLSCGDISGRVILEAAEAYRCRMILAVNGNHDPDISLPDQAIDMHLKVHRYAGYVFGGLNGSWKYKPRGHFLYDQEEVDAFLESFPPVDVFFSHNSPRGIHDRDDEVHVGFDGLKSYIVRTKPKLLIHGHQHLDKETQLGQTTIIGVYGYKLIDPSNPP